MEIGSAKQPLSQPAADSSPYTGEPLVRCKAVGAVGNRPLHRGAFLCRPRGGAFTAAARESPASGRLLAAPTRRKHRTPARIETGTGGHTARPYSGTEVRRGHIKPPRSPRRALRRFCSNIKGMIPPRCARGSFLCVFHRKTTTGYAGGTKKLYLWIEKEDLR